ncbi:MAG: hypothetical protein J7J42_07515 [Thermoplasmata archaeon]|nr:hypothetical protein [Thermoplasmata archaeon]
MEAKSIEIKGEDLIDLMERLERMRDEMNDLIEMLEILLDRELLDSIERGKEDIKEGRIYTLQEFKKMVKE